jgi:hypothetical protein
VKRQPKEIKVPCMYVVKRVHDVRGKEPFDTTGYAYE